MKKEAESYFKYLQTIGVEYLDRDQTAARRPIVTDEGETALAVKNAGRKSNEAQTSSLAELAKNVAKCKKCVLHKTRTQTVFGSGDEKAKIMFVGEAPGADEDEQGLPFVGRAGKLLTSMIEAERSLAISRGKVYIANVLKCRPPGNRPPAPDEVESCEGYLKTQIALIKPSFICALGTHAAHTLLKTKEPIGKLRGRWFEYEGIPLLATFHPSFLNRSPEYKKESWKDLLMLKEAAGGK